MSSRTWVRRQRRATLYVAVVAAAAVLAGCTTVTRTATVSVGAGDQTAGTGANGTPGALASGDGSVAGGPGGATAAANGGTGSAGSAGYTASPGGNAATGSGGAGRPAGASCSKTVKLGVSYSSDLATGLAAVGNPGAATQAGDLVKQTQAMYQRAVDDLNAHGGLAGCKVQLVYHDFKALGADGFSGESQTECADFAEDQHVFAVIAAALENKTLIDCLAQHKTPVLFGGSEYNPVSADYAKYRGFLYQPAYLNPDRFGPYIDQWRAAGYFNPTAKVGILLADDGYGNNQRLVDQIWKPKLAALGITPVVFTFKMIAGYSDVSSVTSQMGSAVLQFRGQGVDHVMMTPDGGDATIFFTQVASNQKYYPRYALTSQNTPAVWGSEPADQRPNAVDISSTTFDLGQNPDQQQVASLPPSPARTACDALFKGHTGTVPMTAVYALCDQMNFLRLALNGAPEPSTAALLAGAERLGNSMATASGFANAMFRPNGYDGGSASRAMRWDEPSQAWKYVAAPQPIPS